MRLTWRDALASLFVVAGLAFGISVVAGWGWPLMNGVRAGIIALGVMSFIACPLSGWAEKPEFYKSTFFAIGAILGVAVLGLIVIGLITGSVVFLQWMIFTVAVLWALTLLDRVIPEGRPRPAAG